MKSFSQFSVGSRTRVLRAADATVIELLEGRRLFAVTPMEEIHDVPPEAGAKLGEVMAVRGNLILVGQPAANVDLKDGVPDTDSDGDGELDLDAHGNGVLDLDRYSDFQLLHDGTEDAIGRVKLIDATTGAVVATIENPEPNDDDFFGAAVTFVGDGKIAITSVDNPSGLATGSVYIYSLTNGVPSATPTLEITGGGSGALFGGTLASVGNDVLIADTQGGTGGSGIVYRYRTATTATAAAGTIVGTYTFGDTFNALGQNMAVNPGDGHVAVTARDNGVPVVLEFDENSEFVRKYQDTASATGDFFGLAFHGASILVGDIANDRVVEFNRDDEAGVRRIIANPDPWQYSEQFGARIAVSGDKFVITAPQDFDAEAGKFRGRAYVYDSASVAPLALIDNPADSTFDDTFGAQIGVLGDGDVVISNPTEDFSGKADAGGIYVYSLAAGPTAVLDAAGDLTVTGTPEGETVLVSGTASGIVVFVDGEQVGGAFAVRGSIIVRGGAGDDTITSDSTNTFPTLIHGGDGNDTVRGGGGNDFLFGDGGNDALSASQGNDVAVGGDGNDRVRGGTGRDVLIGGDGADDVEGNSADDILVAGSTSYDGDATTDRLATVRDRWLLPDVYADRITKIEMLSDFSVSGDDDTDTLQGGSGMDWFRVGEEDVLKDLKRTETVD